MQRSTQNSSKQAPKMNVFQKQLKAALRKQCPYSEVFWYAFFRIRTEYGEIRSISPDSVQMRENADQNNSEQGNFSRSAINYFCKTLHRRGLTGFFEIHLFLRKFSEEKSCNNTTVFCQICRMYYNLLIETLSNFRIQLYEKYTVIRCTLR